MAILLGNLILSVIDFLFSFLELFPEQSYTAVKFPVRVFMRDMTGLCKLAFACATS